MAKSGRFIKWAACAASFLGVALFMGQAFAQNFGSNGPNPPANSPSDPAPVVGCEVRTDTPVNVNGDHVALQCGLDGSLKVGAGAVPAGGATAANQTATHSAVGTSATTAETIQGSPTGVPVPVSSAPSTAAAAAIVPAVAGSAAASLVLKASAGNLYEIDTVCFSACWLMVFNAVAAPGDGVTTAGIASGNLQQCIPIAAGAYVNIAPPVPERYSVGITAVISSTACGTKTAAGSGFIHGMVQ